MKTETLAHNSNTVTFAGTVRVTTRDGQSGVVFLDKEVAGAKYAVISPYTRGRDAIMNGTGLKKDTRVTGVGEPGSEALRALSIQKIN